MRNFSLATVVASLVLSTSVSFADSVYNGQKPESGEQAKEICESQGHSFLGSVALIKSEGGELHPDGPSRDAVDANFAGLAQRLESSDSEVNPKFAQADSWEWLETRFLCHNAKDESLSFVLRARSADGLIKAYELTYVYGATNVSAGSNGEVLLADSEIELSGKPTFSMNGGFSEAPIDGPFVKSVLGVVFGSEGDLQIPLQ